MGGFGRGDGGQGCSSKAIKALLILLDSLLSICIFAPLVVGYWRGCWQLMDIFLFPDNTVMSMVVSLALGVISGLLFCLIQDPLNNIFDHNKHPKLHLIMSRVYTFVYCVCCVNHWRGVWMAWDIYTGISWQSGATSFGIGLVTLAITRGLKNILAPPFFVVPDYPKEYFTVPTLFGAEKERWGYFLLDTIFTVVVTGCLVVFVWRGSWVFLDALLYPDNIVYSAWGSMILGMAVTVVTFLAQLILVPCARHINNGLLLIILEDVYHTVCFIGDVNVWRGVWFLLNIYLLPDMPTVSNFLTSIGGWVVLMCLYNANSILVRGAVMDGDKPRGKGIIFPTHYLRFFYKKKKMEEQRQSDVWVTDGSRPPPVISRPLEGSLSSKANGVCDGRGFGDGHSFSGAFNEGYTPGPDEVRGASPKTFMGREASPSLRQDVNIPKASHRKDSSHQSETPF